jgi:integrase/recombinase XerD
MTVIAPTLQAFFTERLLNQLRASPNTIASYRDAFRLLLGFVFEQTGKHPSRLELSDLDAPTIGAFLEHLEHTRENSTSTRNNRLAAIHSFFHYAALRHPEQAGVIQRVLAIPAKRTQRTLVTFLTPEQIDALLTSPDRSNWTGRRDHALLLVAVQTGLRISELIGLTRGDIELGTGAHLRCIGKGRKERITPFTAQTVAVLQTWTRELGSQPDDPLFPSRAGGRLSRDAIERRLAKYTTTVRLRCPSIGEKRITAHVLRHTAAMTLLQAGIDTSTIALWLGHQQVETTHIYLHADLALKERALARTTPPNTNPGRYRATDNLLAFLDGL